MLNLLLRILSQLPFLGSIKSKTFPEPLKLAEEKSLILKMKDGDTEARNTLIEHNLRLVAHIVKKYESSINEKDDLLSIGTIGLIKAIDSFNNDKGTKLATYAAKCIENEILMQLRVSKKKRNNQSLYETIGYDKEGNKISLIHVLKDDAQPIEDQIIINESIERLHSLLPNLPEREYDIITRRYGLLGKQSETQREIAKSMSISRSYVSRIEKRALMKLYRMYLENNKE